MNCQSEAFEGTGGFVMIGLGDNRMAVRAECRLILQQRGRQQLIDGKEISIMKHEGLSLTELIQHNNISFT